MNAQELLHILAFVSAGLAVSLAIRFAGVMVLCGGSIAGCFGYIYAMLAQAYGIMWALLAALLFGFFCANALTYLWGHLKRESFELSTLAVAILAGEAFKQLPYTGGVYGIVRVPVPFAVSPFSDSLLVFLGLSLCVVCFFSAHRVNSGRQRDAALFRLTSRLHAESVGLSARQSHGPLFLTVTTALGLVGILSVWSLGGIHPESFGLSLNLSCLTAGVLASKGGDNLVLGAVFCAVFALFSELLRYLPWPSSIVGNIQQIIIGAALLALLLLRPVLPIYVKLRTSN